MHEFFLSTGGAAIPARVVFADASVAGSALAGVAHNWSQTAGEPHSGAHLSYTMVQPVEPAPVWMTPPHGQDLVSLGPELALVGLCTVAVARDPFRFLKHCV
jgi:hypothetical protein